MKSRVSDGAAIGWVLMHFMFRRSHAPIKHELLRKLCIISAKWTTSTGRSLRC